MEGLIKLRALQYFVGSSYDIECDEELADLIEDDSQRGEEEEEEEEIDAQDAATKLYESRVANAHVEAGNTTYEELMRDMRSLAETIEELQDEHDCLEFQRCFGCNMMIPVDWIPDWDCDVCGCENFLCGNEWCTPSKEWLDKHTGTCKKCNKRMCFDDGFDAFERCKQGDKCIECQHRRVRKKQKKN